MTHTPDGRAAPQAAATGATREFLGRAGGRAPPARPDQRGPAVRSRDQWLMLLDGRAPRRRAAQAGSQLNRCHGPGRGSMPASAPSSQACRAVKTFSTPSRRRASGTAGRGPRSSMTGRGALGGVRPGRPASCRAAPAGTTSKARAVSVAGMITVAAAILGTATTTQVGKAALAFGAGRAGPAAS
jgi:hypothetical protein